MLGPSLWLRLWQAGKRPHLGPQEEDWESVAAGRGGQGPIQVGRGLLTWQQCCIETTSSQ